MGLLSFAKSAGRKMGFFGGSAATAAEEAAKAALAASEAASDEAEREVLHRKAVTADITAAIQSHGLTISDLEAGFDGENVMLWGAADTQADKEKAILIAGNTEGVSGVDADKMTVVNPEPEAVYHTVVSGDSLSKIAKVQYGDAMQYPRIFEANKPMLTHPDKIYPGQVLRIPPMPAANA